MDPRTRHPDPLDPPETRVFSAVPYGTIVANLLPMLRFFSVFLLATLVLGCSSESDANGSSGGGGSGGSGATSSGGSGGTPTGGSGGTSSGGNAGSGATGTGGGGGSLMVCGESSDESGAGDAPENGPVYHVDPNHPSASDAGPGSESEPWATLQKAVATAQAGDTVLVHAGTYVDEESTYYSGFTPAASGQPGNPIVFRSEPRHAAVLQSKDDFSVALSVYTKSHVIIDGFRVEGTLKVEQSDHVTLENNELTGGTLEGDDVSLHWGLALHTANHCLVRNNLAHQMKPDLGNAGINSAAIMVFGDSQHNVIENNEADASGRIVRSAFGSKAGPSCNLWRRNIARNAVAGYLGKTGTGQETPVEDNVFYQNISIDNESAFELYGYTQRFQIYNNTAIGGAEFVHAAWADNGDARVFNNVAVWGGQPAPDYSGDPEGTVYYWDGYAINAVPSASEFGPLFAHAARNCYTGFGRLAYLEAAALGYEQLSDWQNQTGFDQGSVYADPGFVDLANEDLHLATTSPCSAIGVDEADLDGDGDTTEAIPAGVYVSGNETIGRF